MAVRLFLRDNTDGTVHEYGDSCHDSLYLMEDGSLHYTNMQSCTGTMFPEEGYSFCDENGNTDFDYQETGERIYDIGGYQHPAWISTKNRLPDNELPVLATVNGYFEKRISVVRYIDGSWYSAETGLRLVYCAVEAWMPLPELYFTWNEATINDR